MIEDLLTKAILPSEFVGRTAIVVLEEGSVIVAHPVTLILLFNQNNLVKALTEMLEWNIMKALQDFDQRNEIDA